MRRILLITMTIASTLTLISCSNSHKTKTIEEKKEVTKEVGHSSHSQGCF